MIKYWCWSNIEKKMIHLPIWANFVRVLRKHWSIMDVPQTLREHWCYSFFFTCELKPFDSKFMWDSQYESIEVLGPKIILLRGLVKLVPLLLVAYHSCLQRPSINEVSISDQPLNLINALSISGCSQCLLKPQLDNDKAEEYINVLSIFDHYQWILITYFIEILLRTNRLLD